MLIAVVEIIMEITHFAGESLTKAAAECVAPL